MKPSKSALLLSFVTLMLMAGCSDDGKDRAQAVAVSVRAVSESANSRSEAYSASFMPNREVETAFQVSGYVETITQVVGADGRMRDIQMGDPVKKNELLATIKSDTYSAQLIQLASALETAKAAEARYQRDFQRDSELMTKHVIADSEYDYAVQEYQSAQAQVRQAEAALRQARINLGYCELQSPMDGVILGRSIEIGSLVQPTSSAFHIADTSVLKAVFGVPDVEVSRFEDGEEETLTSDALPGHKIKGTITRIDPEADPTTRTFDIEISVPNSDQTLRAGMIASLDAAQTMMSDPLTPTLPIAAIVRPPQDSSNFAVYVARNESGRTIARLRLVKLGAIEGNEIGVASGVRPGDLIIVRGSTMVNDGSEVRIIP